MIQVEAGSARDDETDSSHRRFESPSFLERFGLLLVCLAMAVGSLILRAMIPLQPMYRRVHDDQLQMEQAASLLAGDWVGPWSELTLSKGLVYPIYLAAIHPLGLNPAIWTTFVYLAGCGLIATGIWLWFRHRILVATLFGALAFNPVIYGSSMSSIYREQFVVAVVPVVVGAAIILSYLIVKRQPSPRWFLATLASLMMLSVGLGLLFETRFDTYWVWFAAFALLTCNCFVLRPKRELLVRIGAIGLTGLFSIGTVIGLGSFISSTNVREYGVALTNDYAAGTFAAAFKTMTSIEAGKPSSGVPITSAQLEAAYAVSPAARELEQPLQTLAPKWQRFGCSRGAACDGVPGILMPWTIRGAAAEAGYRTPTQFQEYFGRLDRELADACASGALRCGSRPISVGTVALDRTKPGPIAETFVQTGFRAYFLYTWGYSDPDPERVARTADDFARYERSATAVNGLSFEQEQPSAAAARTVSIVSDVYLVLTFVAVIPAFVGLVAGLLRSSPARRSALIGWSVLLAMVAHLGLLSLWSGSAGGTLLQPASYTAESVSLWILSLVMGVFALWLAIRESQSRGLGNDVVAEADSSGIEPSPADQLRLPNGA